MARGIFTIGYGHVIKYGENFNGGITRADAELLFAKDVASHAEQIYTQIKVPLTQNQFDALVSFCFNMGASCLKSTAKGLRDRVNSGDFDEAANAFMLYVKQKNKAGGYDVVKGLYNRRYSEMKIFKFGIYERFNG